MNTVRNISKTAEQLVTFTIKINGDVLTRSANIISIIIDNEVNRLSCAKVTIADGNAAQQDFRESASDNFIPGNIIEIFVGNSNAETLLFKGIIVKQALKVKQYTTPCLIIECKHKAIALSINKANKYFSDISFSECWEEIVQAKNISADIESTRVKQKEIVQFNSTDWDFIISTAEANGKICICEQDSLHITAPLLNTEPIATALFGATIIEMDAEMDARFQYNSVETKTWDYTSQQVKYAEANGTTFTEQGNISSTDLAFILSAENYSIQHGGSLDDNLLQCIADAQLVKSRLAKIRGRVKLSGVSGIKTGDIITLDGTGNRFNGNVFVSGTRHEIINGNWNTHIQFGLSSQWFSFDHDIHHASAAGIIPAIKGLHIGIVTDLEDPASEDRVKIKLPEISVDEEGTWARIVSLDAGNNRGAFFRPEINDEVLVGFLDNDPRFPVIMGMLNSSAKPAPIRGANPNNQKGFITRSGVTCLFDDEKKSILINTPSGKKIEIDDSAGLMKMEDEMGNIFKMEQSGITMQATSNITITAGATLTLGGAQLVIGGNNSSSVSVESSGQLELKSNGVTVVKGAVVQIN